MKLFVDDIRDLPEDKQDWTLIRTPQEAVDLIAKGEVTHISLDHDLAAFTADGKEITGYAVALFLSTAVELQKVQVPQEMLCHSDNPPGREAIYSVFDGIRRRQEKKQG